MDLWVGIFFPGAYSRPLGEHFPEAYFWPAPLRSSRESAAVTLLPSEH